MISATIITADDAAPLFRAAMERVAGKEAIFVLPLDGEGRKITNPTLVAFGAEKTAACEPKTIFRAVFGANAESFVVAHNHPSGNPTPSRADVEMTRKLVAGAALLGVRLLDHLVIGSPDCEEGRGFVSIMERMENAELLKRRESGSR